MYEVPWYKFIGIRYKYEKTTNMSRFLHENVVRTATLPAEPSTSAAVLATRMVTEFMYSGLHNSDGGVQDAPF